MLATVGFLVQQKIHFVSSEADPLKAISALGYGPNLQVLFAIGCVELATWEQTFNGSGTPGDFKFDPMNQMKGKSDKAIAELKLKELKNGRLAMVGRPPAHSLPPPPPSLRRRFSLFSLLPCPPPPLRALCIKFRLPSWA